jgi:CheY-like chemotaxis protein
VIKLLLADDSVTIQRVVELTFSGEDVQVIAVGDGEQAIARVPSERPDIVLADIGMPKRNGYDVAAFVKGSPDFAHIPVVLLAGAFEPVDEARAKEVKCDGVLVKPFEPQQLISRVHDLVDGRRPAATPPAVIVSTPPPRRAEPPAPPPAVAPPESQRAKPTAVPAPEPARARQADEAAEGSLDDYFDRLDAAFATLGATASPESPGRGPLEDPFADRAVPTVDHILADTPLRPPTLEPPDMTPMLTAAPPAPPAAPQLPAVASTGNPIADVFRALFAAEEGEGEAALRFPAAATQPIVTEQLVEDVTRRVLERLAPGTARQLVADIVSDVAERLVREEIRRIKNGKAQE